MNAKDVTGIRIRWFRATLTDVVIRLEINGSVMGPGPGVWTGEHRWQESSLLRSWQS